MVILTGNTHEPASGAPREGAVTTTGGSSRAGSLLRRAASPRGEIQLGVSVAISELRAVVGAPAQLAGPIALSAVRRGGIVVWTGELPEELPAATALRLHVSWRGGGSQANLHIGANGSFWLGRIAPWYPQVDNIGKHVGRIAFRAPVGYTIAATGRRVEAEPGSVATYDVVVPSSFNFAVAKYHVQEAGGDVRLGAYLLRPRPHGTALVDGAREILQSLRAILGPFPYPEFALVEAPEEFGISGSMAATVEGLTFVHTGLLAGPLNRRTGLTSPFTRTKSRITDPPMGAHVVVVRRDGKRVELTTEVTADCTVIQRKEARDAASLNAAPPETPPDTGRFEFAVACRPSCTRTEASDGQQYWKFEGEPPVAAVRAGSPAEEAGMRVGDIIVAVDGDSVRSETGAPRLLNSSSRMELLTASDEEIATLRIPYTRGIAIDKDVCRCAFSAYSGVGPSVNVRRHGAHDRSQSPPGQLLLSQRTARIRPGRVSRRNETR